MGAMLLGVILFLYFLHHKQRSISPIILIWQISMPVTTEMTAIRLTLMAVFWGHGRAGSKRQEGLAER